MKTIPTLYQDNHARFAGALLIAAPRMRYLHAIHILRASLKGATMAQRVARLRSIAHLYDVLGHKGSSLYHYHEARDLSRHLHSLHTLLREEMTPQEYRDFDADDADYSTEEGEP